MTYSHRAACLMQNHFTLKFCGVARQGCKNWLAWSAKAGGDTVTKAQSLRVSPGWLVRRVII